MAIKLVYIVRQPEVVYPVNMYAVGETPIPNADIKIK